MPNVELSLSNLGWNGDLSTDATGDIVLAQDVPNAPLASQQRIYRMCQTNPRQFDDSGNPVSFGNDLFAQDYGGGLRLATGQMITPVLVGEIESRLNNGLQADPTIASSPAPNITVQNVGSNIVQVDLTCESVTGETITLPSFQLSLSGSGGM